MAKCRACGAPISFRATRNDKQQPVNANGTPHHATCIGIPRPPKPDPTEQPALIDRGHCPHECTQDGWIELEGGVRRCPIHRKGA